jgi:glycosyltransferase involved in cell wall biosynthesis
MKVFLSGTSLLTRYGGPAFSVSRLALALADEDIDVGVWAPDQSAVHSPLLPVESRVQRLCGSVDQALDAFGAPDVIHDSGLWLRHNHQLATVAASRRVPRVVSTRGMLEPWAMQHKRSKKQLGWFLYQRRDLARASALHATTAQEAANVENLRLGVPVWIIPNGIDLPELAASPKVHSQVKTALFLGRIYPVKGLPMLIEAWAQVHPKNWRLKIAGPDEAGHLADVVHAVRQAGLQDVVTFVGEVTGSAKSAVLQEADLFVLPTLSESFGMAIAEALAFQVPVLTTTRAPWPELDELGCGWRVDPNVDDLAAGIRQATSLGDHGLRAMGTAGRRFVGERFRWDRVATTFKAVYATVSGRS